MQSLFDISMPTSLSYLVAVLVILGLLAIFAIIVRRVAAHGPNPEGHLRGRGPRLGVVDTFPLDKDRQLVIVRRDNVEHLLMIGGTNDVVVETNIVRTIGAQAVRDTFSATQDALQSTTAVLPLELPMSAAPVQQTQSSLPLSPQALAQSTPRLRSAQPQLPTPPASRMPIADVPNFGQAASAPSQNSFVETHDTSADVADYQIQNAEPEQEAPPAPRQVLTPNELMALAKRLEASIPTSAPLKAEKPAQPVPPPASAPYAPHFEPQQPHADAPQMQPLIAQPLMPQTSDPQSSRPTLRPPVNLQPPMPQPRSPQIRAPQQSFAPQSYAPQEETLPEPPAQVAMTPPLPQQATIPVPQQAVQAQPIQQPSMAPFQQDAPGERQPSALDENLRRLLGRKVEPRS